MAERRGFLRCFAASIALPLVALVLSACDGGDASPEMQIRRLIERGVEAAEARSADDLQELLHPDYRDQKGYNREQLGKLLQAYFIRHRNIHLFTRIDDITLLDENRAEVHLHVAMASSVISDITALPGLRARIYRFELQLARQQEWLLQHASWSPASLSDLQ